jgi:hypothetical protein
MRIGTWNLQGRWDHRHLAMLEDASCDVWLLTEVNVGAELPGYDEARTQTEMATKRAWAGVFFRRELRALPDPHPATAAALVDGVTFWSSILPWRSCGSDAPWQGARHADKTRATIEGLIRDAPRNELVWGGDWNHAMSGTEYVGTIGGRGAIRSALTTLGLRAPTAELAHRQPGLLSIDHIGVPAGWDVEHAGRTVAEADGARLSDHDLYVIEAKSATAG